MGRLEGGRWRWSVARSIYLLISGGRGSVARSIYLLISGGRYFRRKKGPIDLLFEITPGFPDSARVHFERTRRYMESGYMKRCGEVPLRSRCTS